MTTTATVPVSRAVAAELARAKGSASARFAWFGLGICILQGLGWWGVATGPMPSWDALFGWQTLYATGLLAPIVALLAATTIARERNAREGGTWVRPVSARAVVTARGIVLAGQSLLLHAAITLPLIGFGLAGGLASAPFARFVALWLVLWAAALLPLAVGFVLARRIGLIPTVGLMLVWQIVGTVQAETPAWWAQPWTWAVHAIMPVLGIHANGVRLEPEAVARTWNPWWPALASVVLACAVLALSAARSTASADRHRPLLVRITRRPMDGLVTEPVAAPARTGLSTHGTVTPGHPSHLRAHLVAWRGTAILPLVPAAVVALGLVAVVWSPGYVAGFATWIVLPLGACILACLTESANAPGRRVALLRRSADREALLTGLVGTAVVLGIALLTGVLVGSTSGLRLGLLLTTTGVMVHAVSAWLSTRFAPAAAIGVTLVALIVSLVFGGTWIAQGPLWTVGVLGWPLSATTPGRILVAVAASLLVTAVAVVAHTRAIAGSVR